MHEKLSPKAWYTGRVGSSLLRAVITSAACFLRVANLSRGSLNQKLLHLRVSVVYEGNSTSVWHSPDNLELAGFSVDSSLIKSLRQQIFVEQVLS